MKKRNRMRRQKTNSFGLGLSGMMAGRAKRPRKSTWTFERLEDRYLMTASPISGFEYAQVVTISNDTPEGQQLIQLLELQAAQQASGLTNDSNYLVPLSLPTDPNLIQQWHLLNVGQVVNYGGFQNIYGTPGEDINVLPVWDQGITGDGILVAIVDTGVQSTHPDLQGNINLVYAFNALNGGSNITPTGTSAAAAHGTEVAGLIGAIAGNGLGGVGVAYGSTIVPIKLLSTDLTPITDQAIANAIIGGGAPIDIFNHSWSPFDPENPRAADGPSALVLEQLIQSATTGRGGLGAIHVFASGNEAGPLFSPGFPDIGFLDSMGSNGYASSRYVISVGAVDHDGSIFNADGTVTLYSEAGAALLVVAPSASGPFDIATNVATGSGIFTTDLTNGGNNIPTLPNGVSQDVDRFPDTNYTSKFGGTSAAAPLVSGVIALMLEADKAANNGVATLSYRDVQEILVRSARQNHPNDGSWIVNSTPFFWDAIQHDPGAPNYNEGGVYPDDEDAWNDEILWQIIPGDITTPAVQAATAMLTSTNGVAFSIHAVAGGNHDGTSGNDIGVEFVTAVGNPGAMASLDGDTITVTVSGTPAWSVIKDAVDAINGGGDFQLVFAAGTDDSKLFSPADVNLTGMLTGGANAVGDSSTVARAPGYEGYNPVLTPLTRNDPALRGTNGAGYTVSQGWITDFASEYGYGHGVVDAELAVQLASQWHLKDQTLAPERTQLFLLVPGYGVKAGEISEGTDAPGDETYVPGGVIGPSASFGSFIDYFQEFFKEPTIIAGEEGDPMAEPPVPATEDSIDPMSLPFRGEDPPGNGRGSYIPVIGPENMSVEWVELKLDIPYSDANLLDALRITLVSPSGTHSELTNFQYFGDVPGNGVQFVRGTSTYDGFSLAIDPPGVLDTDADMNSTFSWTYSTNRNWGERSEGEWQIYMENYGGENFRLGNMALIFHGQDVAEGTDRILGFVDDTSGYLGHGSNVTVYVKDSAGNRVAQFITGADGNYYFDLPQGDYQLGIDVPPGYQSDGPAEVPIADGVHFSISLLVPVSDMVTLSGKVFADLDGDGVQDPQDGGVENVVVYADLNHTGQFDLGEPSTLSDQNGDYSLPFQIDHATFITVGVKPAPGWTTTNPASGLRDQLVELGVGDVSHVNFGIKPPAAPTGQGNASIYGFVFNDVNGDGHQQDAFEFGIAGLTVFIDANQDGIFQADGPDMEVSAITSETGAYQFFDVAPSTVRVAVVVDEDAFQITNPLDGYLDVTVVAGQVASGTIFGIRDLRIYDFGDLVGTDFRTTLAQDGARNYVIPGFSLGSRIDAEVDARIYDPDTGLIDPALSGVGDDLDGPKDASDDVIDDEDGVVLVGGLLRRGSNQLNITVQGVGGYLQGWIDFNNNGIFEDNERVFNNLDINPGPHPLTITAPDTLFDGQVAARFRWGSINKNYFGADFLGEVEDYLFQAKAVFAPGDFNGDDLVDNADYDLWKATFGSTTDLRADANHSGRVDSADYTLWRNHLGQSSGSGGGSGSSATPSELTTSPIAVASVAAPDQSSSLQFVPFLTTVSPRESTQFARRHDHVTSDSSGADLLLVDRVLSRFGGSDDGLDEAAPLRESGRHHDDDFALALASAFEDDADWWTMR